MQLSNSMLVCLTYIYVLRNIDGAARMKSNTGMLLKSPLNFHIRVQFDPNSHCQQASLHVHHTCCIAMLGGTGTDTIIFINTNDLIPYN